MTQSHKAKALKFTGGILGGGLFAGMLMALATPTTMTQKAESLRDLIGVPDAEADTTPVLAFEAPPEDLTPVSWQTAQQEYSSYTADQAYIAPVSDDDLLDSSVPLPNEAEAPPSETGDRPRTVVLASVGDAASDWAEAARDAATDVRTAESAATQSDPITSADDARATVEMRDLAPTSTTSS